MKVLHFLKYFVILSLLVVIIYFFIYYNNLVLNFLKLHNDSVKKETLEEIKNKLNEILYKKFDSIEEIYSYLTNLVLNCDCIRTNRIVSNNFYNIF